MEHIPNEEIRRRTGRVFTSADRIESKQLLWYGHVNRMNQERWPKIAMEYDPQNRRRRGRPGRKWIDGIRETMIDRAKKIGSNCKLI